MGYFDEQPKVVNEPNVLEYSVIQVEIKERPAIGEETLAVIHKQVRVDPFASAEPCALCGAANTACTE